MCVTGSSLQRFPRACGPPSGQSVSVTSSKSSEVSPDVADAGLLARLQALTDSTLGDRWSVWLGDESHGSFDNEAEALDAARALAAETGRSAWLDEAGNPPIQIAEEDS